MPRKFIRKYLPDHHSVRQHRALRWFQPLLRQPNLWHLNRHSVAGGVAAGLFGGLVPGPVQMGLAAALALIFRVNILVAMATTLYTNPITWGPLIFAAYEIGRLVTGEPPGAFRDFDFDWNTHAWSEFLPALWDWFAGLGTTFLIGDLILASLLAVLGYVGVQLAWRLHVLAYLRRRRRRH
jgi:uncharacterized protein (DUF2062 family)